MRFVVDETSWQFDNLSQREFIDAFESMLDVLEDAETHKQESCYSEDLFSIPVLGEKTFYDLYEEGSPVDIPREVRERIASVFSRMPKWQELDLPWPPSIDVQVGPGRVETAPSVAWAHAQTTPDLVQAVACVVFSLGRPCGHFHVTVDGVCTPLWFAGDSQAFRDFYRWLIVETTRTPDEMERMVMLAFPSVDFVEGAFNGIKNMSKPYRDLVRDLVLHLGAFSDHGKRIFGAKWQDAPAEFSSLGVDISDENGNTKSDKAARKARTLNIEGKDIIFWWHSKLEPHTDRIHICPDRVNTGGNIIVGIFCRHL